MIIIYNVFCIVYYYSGDFLVQFNHGTGPKSDASVFQLLYHTASVMLKKSNKLHTKKINIYCRILWSKYVYVCIIVYNILMNMHK